MKKMDGLSRRQFFSNAAKAGVAVSAAAAAGTLVPEMISKVTGGGEGQALAAGGEKHIFFSNKEVLFYDKLPDKKIKCKTCPRECTVGDRERGFCGNKENHGGKYYTLAYGNPCSANTDPIEKKPLFHFLPGTQAFSLSTAGCNFDCKFCQNWEISQSRPEQTRNYRAAPDDVVSYSRRTGAGSVAYTYGEPVVFLEYMLDCAAAAKKAGLRNVMISNGYINKKPLQRVCRAMDAIKIDFKAFSDKFYRDVCLGELKPVLETMQTIKSEGVWLELVTLLVPSMNDSADEMRKMSKWVKKNLGADVPVHFSRLSPMYKLKNLQPTPVSTMNRAYNIAKDEGLHFVYLGNVPGSDAENTYCPKCKKKIIGRYGFTVTENNIVKGRCRFCNAVIPGVWV